MSPATLIDGKAIAASIEAHLKNEVAVLKRSGIKPSLAVVLIGNDPASKIYVKHKKRACDRIGIESREYLLPHTCTQSELVKLINTLNADDSVNGILVQLPLPPHIDTEIIITTIHPAKDVDGFHPTNQGRLLTGTSPFPPCTPAGIMKMLDSIGYNPDGKHAVIVGRSNIVGKPTAIMLLNRHATVTICHSHTKDLHQIIKSADILITAIGKPEYIKAEWIKRGAVVIDVGISTGPKGNLKGDVEFEAARQRAAFITPVPGGVGPMTIAMLMKNTVKAARKGIKYG